MTDTNNIGPWDHDGQHVFEDTRQQVCCGRGHSECCGSPDVEGDIVEIARVAYLDHIDLITAAPELLAALTKIVERITYYAELKEGEIPNIEDWAYTYNSGDMAAARAALAKATGAPA